MLNKWAFRLRIRGILTEKNKVVWFSKDQRIVLEEIESLESLLCH